MKNILIVIDMQKDFVDGSLGTDEAVSIVPNVCKKIKEFEGEIFVTKDTHTENYLETSEGKKLPIVHCIKNTRGWQLDTKVENALHEKHYRIVEKSSFGSLKLPQIISENIENDDFSIEIIGLCTDICVVSNALILKASFPEITIKVISNCCAGVTVESHLDALKIMQACQIEIV